jgi:hypothetical protein
VLSNLIFVALTMGHADPWLDDYFTQPVRVDHLCARAAANAAIQEGRGRKFDSETEFPPTGARVFDVVRPFKEYIIRLNTDAEYFVVTELQADGTCKATHVDPR